MKNSRGGKKVGAEKIEKNNICIRRQNKSKVFEKYLASYHLQLDEHILEFISITISRHMNQVRCI